MCCVFLMTNPFQGLEKVVGGLFSLVISQMRGASENNLENAIFFSSLVNMRTDSFLKKF